MQFDEIISSGVHFLTEPIRVPSGTHLTAEQGCRLIGGVSLSGKYTMLENGVYVCDLQKYGVNPAHFVSRGFGRAVAPSHSALFIDGKPMQIARYPKKDFLKITDVGEATSNEWGNKVGALKGGFYYEDARPEAWRDGEIWVHGYWAYDWSPTCERIELWDKARGFIRNAEPYGLYSYIVGQRFYFFNVIDEVTCPGDYAIDFDRGLLYFLPPEDFDPATGEVFLSTADTPAFLIEDAEDVRLAGFRIECFRGDGIVVHNAKNVSIADCTIKNIGNRAVVVMGSENVVVSGCHIHDTGDAGVDMFCGDRKTLTSANCGVENCHIHHVAAWNRCYQPPVKLTGVGLFARGNLLHDCPHSAVLYGGNEIHIENNEIYRVVQETGDAGAIYAGRDYTWRGNVVAGNFVHHVGSGIGMGTMGVYNDDCLSGTVMRDNVFYKVQRALFLGGGVDFVCDNNILIECTPGIEIDGRGQNDHDVWRKMVTGYMRDRFYHIDGNTDVSGAEPPYITKYPELKKIDDYYRSSDAPHIPPSARITNNIFVVNPDNPEEQRVKFTWNTDGGTFEMENNRDSTLDAILPSLTVRQCDVILGRIDF